MQLPRVSQFIARHIACKDFFCCEQANRSPSLTFHLPLHWKL